MCHINFTPDEVLVRFFDGCTTLKELKNCAFVSKRWFEVAQEHPIFWSCAQVGIRHTLELFLRRLNRRRGLPVIVRAYVYGSEWHDATFKAIAENMHRITDLKVETSAEERVLQDLSACAPILETLSLRGSLRRESWSHLTSAPHHFLGGYAPLLTSVELADVAWVFNAQNSIILPTVLNVSVKCSLAFQVPGHELEGTPEWLIPPDALDRIATAFPGMVSLKLSLSITRAVFMLDGRLPYLHPFLAAPPSEGTKRVLGQLRALQARWCASGWSVIQHFPIASIAQVDIRTEYQDTDVALACVPQVSFAVYVGVVEPDIQCDYEGTIRIYTDGNALQRTIVAPVEDCWSLSVLGPILLSQFQHLCLLSITDAAFECLLNCGVDDLPALWALRIELVSYWLSARLPTYRAVDEENDPVSCSALRVLMFEADVPLQDMSAKDLESFLDLIDAERDAVTLGLRGLKVTDDLHGFAASMFERVVVDNAVLGEGWMTRAHRLSDVPAM
ncbi:hypothetical protein AURDEDRAFT_125555 [Auricularia subglabra TFB-10046 SS5]|nr:hypothetical protein AURDEDRAFT_125555 [Auricularia subglabra TFB-10046 SS5]